MVVINQHNHIGQILSDPFTRPFIACEDRREVIVARLALVGGYSEQREHGWSLRLQ